jgi:hypothetical protein
MTLAELHRAIENLPDGAALTLPVVELRAALREWEAHGNAVPVSYDTDEAARALAVSPKTVAGWCHAGRFPGARRTGGRGGKWIIPAAAVVQYLNEQRAGARRVPAWGPPAPFARAPVGVSLGCAAPAPGEPQQRPFGGQPGTAGAGSREEGTPSA